MEKQACESKWLGWYQERLNLGFELCGKLGATPYRTRQMLQGLDGPLRLLNEIHDVIRLPGVGKASLSKQTARLVPRASQSRL
jgi:hypothetical protein